MSSYLENKKLEGWELENKEGNMSFCAEPFNLDQGKLREAKNLYDQACKWIVFGILTLRVRCHRGAEGPEPLDITRDLRLSRRAPQDDISQRNIFKQTWWRLAAMGNY